MEYITKTSKETESLGRALAKKIIGPEVILLKGEMGSGKTTFVQGFAKGLGIKSRIVSPTYIILRKYNTPGAVVSFFYHIDLYRLDANKNAQDELGISDILSSGDGISIVEWGEKLISRPEHYLEIRLTKISENERKINETIY